MSARPIDHDIKDVNDDLLEMTRLVEKTILDSIKSLKEQDSELARTIIANDEKIDDLEDKIRDKCLKILATQQPLAGDLRYMISIMQMVRDLERIGDHCEDIAKYTLRFENMEFIKELIDIPIMADMSARMVKNATDAFVNRDLRLARKVWKADEEVDEMFRNIYDELMGIVKSEPEKSNQSVMLLFIAAHLERIADYATNICEETVFAMEGNYEME